MGFFHFGEELVDSLDVCNARGKIEAERRRHYNFEILLLQEYLQNWQWQR